MFPHELSGGQQQRVALARTLAPGHGLSYWTSLMLALIAVYGNAFATKSRLHVLKAAGAAALMVTHDAEDDDDHV